MEVPKKTKIELPYDLTLPLLGIYPDKAIAALFTMTKIWKEPKCP